jgi:asparaginyl-tRNA synthetase
MTQTMPAPAATEAGTTEADVLPALPVHLAAPATQAAIRIQDRVLDAARQELRAQGFVELLPPMIGPVTDPGGRGSKQVDIDFYGHRYKLMTSAILYKQAAVTAFDKIFCVAPNVRLEPLETRFTGRHLAEFHQLDIEIANATREDAMEVLQSIVKASVRRVLSDLPADLAVLERDPAAFAALLDGPFDRMTHHEAVERLAVAGHTQSPDAEIDWEAEKVLSKATDRPFFVTDYPKGSRGFYDRESRTIPGTLRNFDLLAPDGYGELASGSEREHEYRRIVARIRETGENPAKYEWYLQMAKDGIPPSAGFGLGLQRLTRYISGLATAWQASAFPKLPGVVSA